MPFEPPPNLTGLSLAQIAALVEARELPPVDQWNPTQTGDSLMLIAADGRWFHDGGEIKRPAMVRAFASLLTRDAGGQHWLVTPHERQSIEVEDAALIAVDVVQHGNTLALRTNTDDLVIAGPDHPITARGDAETPALYVAIRNGIEARLNRSTYLQLIALADEALTVISQGAHFSLVPE